MNPVGAAAELAILRLHQQEFEVIWGSQLLGNTGLTNGFFPEDGALLPTQPIPILLVIIDNGADARSLRALPASLPRPLPLGARHGYQNWCWVNAAQNTGSSSERDPPPFPSHSGNTQEPVP
jgi:hypothetical protein